MISLDLKPSQTFCWILVQNSKIVVKGQQLQEVLVVLESDVCRIPCATRSTRRLASWMEASQVLGIYQFVSL